MTNYFAIIHHDPGSAYGASFPDIPDCFAAADEESDLLSNAICALEDYFADGHKAPEAKGLDEIRREFSVDLAEGAYLLSVPYIPRSTKAVRVNVSLEQGLLQAIDKAAIDLRLNRSAFLAMAAKNEIKQTRKECA